jgi:hypothetical protein
MLVGLAEVMSRQERLAEAEPLLHEALSQAETSLPPDHWRRGEVESAVGAGLSRLGHGDEARPLLASGYDRLRQALGEEHPLTRLARRRLDARERPSRARASSDG